MSKHQLEHTRLAKAPDPNNQRRREAKGIAGNVADSTHSTTGIGTTRGKRNGPSGGEPMADATGAPVVGGTTVTGLAAPAGRLTEVMLARLIARGRPMGLPRISAPVCAVSTASAEQRGIGQRLKRHCGQLESCCSQRATHASWQRCSHGSLIKVSSASYTQRQTAQTSAESSSSAAA